jgi:hypothetical protein
VVETSSRQLREFLAAFGIAADPVLRAHWRRGGANLGPIEPGESIAWTDTDAGAYAWFTIDGVPGGTDVHFQHDPPAIRRYLGNELASNDRFRARADEVRACAATGRRWRVCRWGGAAATTNVAYGVIAAAVATLTDGLLDSEDGAWDVERFPATAAEFLSWWYHPDRAIGEHHRTWATQCLAAIRAGIENPNDAVI